MLTVGQKTQCHFHALIHASEVIAVHFSTIAAANDYWRDE
ncbi:hexameric tyrosine-coordinated heme protein [Haliea sp. E1-2-M8]